MLDVHTAYANISVSENCLVTKNNQMALITPYWFIDACLLVVSLYVLLYKYFTRKFDYWKDRNVPFIKPHAFFGNFKEVSLFKRIAGEHLQHLYNQMKGHRYFGIFIVDKPVLVLRDPELVRTVLVKDFNQFANRTTMVKQDQPIYANGLFFGKDNIWKSLRHQLTKAFTSGKLKQIVPLMLEVCDDLRSYLTQESSKGNFIEAKELCSRYSVDVITSYAYGIKANSFKAKNPEFMAMGYSFFALDFVGGIRQSLTLFAPEVANLLKIKVVGQDVTNFLTNTLLHTLNEREKSQNKRNDRIDLVIEIKNNPEFCEEFGFGKNTRRIHSDLYVTHFCFLIFIRWNNVCSTCDPVFCSRL